MVIFDDRRGIEYHLDLTDDNKIKRVEMIFSEPRSMACLFRPEGLFVGCDRKFTRDLPVSRRTVT